MGRCHATWQRLKIQSTPQRKLAVACSEQRLETASFDACGKPGVKMPGLEEVQRNYDSLGYLERDSRAMDGLEPSIVMPASQEL